MRQPYDVLNDLVNRYPRLYRHGMAFECGAGWAHILDTLSAKHESAIVSMEEDPGYERLHLPVARQVQEKFATLRFYLSGNVTDEIEGWVDEAERESKSVCELCGAPGREQVRCAVRCKAHAEDLR